MADFATDVQTLVIAGAGHWVAEQAPEQMLEAIGAFLTSLAHGRTARTGFMTMAGPAIAAEARAGDGSHR